ncbi:hypothetical protein Q0590_35015 [Rhodocytophaga aerolata]|uniref:Uncharacterized protein n=1 Tax=Rhodocytophaga aerolata TaxID=455078 RepID=A0ABT8RHF8_9BACT|nr:hypothetical protein [Rhodocytophaga aerolata]MDO1451537.1 hypothetical protein [Rhodocytophaga aerolata]
MNRGVPIPIFILYPTDSTRLLVLKSQYNRHAMKYNSLYRYLVDHEKEHLTTILSYLHEQIKHHEQ